MKYFEEKIIKPREKCEKQLDYLGLAREIALNGEHIVSNREEFEALPLSSWQGMFNSLINDFSEGPHLIREIIKDHVSNIYDSIFNKHHFRKEIPDDEPAFVMVPGYFGPNAYMETFSENLPQHWHKIYHPAFDNFRLRGRIKNDALAFFDVIKNRTAPTVLFSHSRGGAIVTELLLKLQKEGLSGVVDAAVIVAGIPNGIRREIDSVARFIPSETIRQMRPSYIRSNVCKNLSKENRKKLFGVVALNGDFFTDKDGMYVDDMTMIVADVTNGHLQECLNPRTSIFRISVAIAHRIAEILDDK